MDRSALRTGSSPSPLTPLLQERGRARTKSAIMIFALFAGLAYLQADDKHLETLQVGTEVYTNVTITSLSATEIFFSHSRGFGNAKLKKLSAELQTKFHFDPVKADELEKERMQGNALFVANMKAQQRSLPIAREPSALSVDMAVP